MMRNTSVLKGAGAGVLATIAMSLLMWGAQKSGGVGRLPPRKIAEAGLAAAGAEKTNETTVKALSTVAHFGFGAAAGSLYAVGTEKARIRGLVPGVVFGLLVWLGSYKGWIPKLGILPEPQDDRPARARTMFLAHVVYGAALSALADFQKRPGVRGGKHPTRLERKHVFAA
jgi:Na+/proline symporter